MLAKDIMRKHVITVAPHMTLHEVARIFGDHRITGAPVVSPQGNVIGVISQTDLVRQESESPAHETPVYHRESDESAGARGFHYEEPDYTRVDQVMTPSAISFDEKTPVYELAKEMLSKHIHRVVITRNAQLCGIVTSMDMLRALLDLMDRSPAAG
jgi:CBS domain-containing protein